MLDFIQQMISGIALGCVYGLIALGFVLIYKATEVVNFAQGEIMMLGAFLSFTFIATLGLNYWLGFLLSIVCMAILGALMERLVVRPILGYPQFSIVMATIGLGLVLRALVGHDLGHRRSADRDAVLRRRRPSSAGWCWRTTICRSSSPPRSCARCSTPSSASPDRHRHAGDLAEHAGRLLHGHSGQARCSR